MFVLWINKWSRYLSIEPSIYLLILLIHPFISVHLSILVYSPISFTSWLKMWFIKVEPLSEVWSTSLLERGRTQSTYTTFNYLLILTHGQFERWKLTAVAPSLQKLINKYWSTSYYNHLLLILLSVSKFPNYDTVLFSLVTTSSYQEIMSLIINITSTISK